jgi:hypothetical protein
MHTYIVVCFKSMYKCIVVNFVDPSLVAVLYCDSFNLASCCSIILLKIQKYISFFKIVESWINCASKHMHNFVLSCHVLWTIEIHIIKTFLHDFWMILYIFFYLEVKEILSESKLSKVDNMWSEPNTYVLTTYNMIRTVFHWIVKFQRFIHVSLYSFYWRKPTNIIQTWITWGMRWCYSFQAVSLLMWFHSRGKNSEF